MDTSITKPTTRVILDRDIIVRVVMTGGVEIDQLPRHIGIERLRWDGRRVIDLADLKTIWVMPDYTLHAIAVDGAQRVEMTYADRHKLRTVDGVITVVDTEQADRLQSLSAGVRRYLDSRAREHGFSSILEASAWSGALPDASRLQTWGAQCVVAMREIESEVIEGVRPVPTLSEVLDEMPELTKERG